MDILGLINRELKDKSIKVWRQECYNAYSPSGEKSWFYRYSLRKPPFLNEHEEKRMSLITVPIKHVSFNHEESTNTVNIGILVENEKILTTVECRLKDLKFN